RRDEIKTVLTDHLATRTTREWLDKLEPADYWAAKVNTIADVVNDPEMNHCDMFQEVVRKNGVTLKTTRCPLRIDGEKLFAQRGAPVLGEDTESINKEFNL
ncbi:MAG: CoA transferase, partial [Rikenellaceae bacterium]